MRNLNGRKSAPTINDIADEAQVSKSTVSLVLKNSPKIKLKTAERVLLAAKKLGYVYNRSAASLRQNSSNIIGLVFSDLQNPFFVELLIGAERILPKSGFTTFMAHTNENLATQNHVLNSMREHNVAGIILCAALNTPNTVPSTIRSWGIPLVVAMRPLEDAESDFVGPNNIEGMTMATHHLIERGHTRIAFIGRHASSYIVSNQRIQGYRNAMAAAHLPVHEDWIIDAGPSYDGGRQGLAKLNALTTRPTATVCYNDAVALGVLSELDFLGLRAGRDLAVVGFDGVAGTAHSSPPLTTISIGPSHLGEVASQLLLERIRTPEARTEPITYLSTPRLIIRQSSSSTFFSENDALLPTKMNDIPL